jgi:membrane fusion protein, multidrug efflux system
MHGGRKNRWSQRRAGAHRGRGRAKLLRAAMVLLLGVLAACNRSGVAQAPAPPPAVGVQQAMMKGVSRSAEFVGRIKAIDIVQLRARVEGFLDKVAFTEGDEVKPGQLLYQIETVQYEAQLEQAKANLAAARSQALNAELQYNRVAELVKRQNISQATVDQDKANLDGARASVLQNEAAVTLAQTNLGYTTIKAPVQGRIGRTGFTQGNLVNPASGVLATIVSQDPIYVLFPVSVRQAEEARAAASGQDARAFAAQLEIVLRLPDGREYQHPGAWNYTDPQVDQQTDTVTLRGTVPNPERLLVDGQFVTVLVRERAEQPRLVIPQAALLADQAGSYVLVVDGDEKAEIRRVATGPEEHADIVVESGLKEGERVIVEGVQKVRPGQVVQATPVVTKGG